MDRTELAIETFNKGIDCDKAVFSAFENDEILSPKEDRYIHSCGEFPGLPHSKCGAVSGAGCVIFHYKENVGHEDTAEEMWQRFKDKFLERNSSLKCTDLIGYDLSVRRDAMEVMEKEVIKKTCPKYIKDAVEILEEVIGVTAEVK